MNMKIRTFYSSLLLHYVTFETDFVQLRKKWVYFIIYEKDRQDDG